ncbi:MAG: hypothetical protein ACLPSH_08905 [Vulcanimicrobiaceae bacterium]
MKKRLGQIALIAGIAALAAAALAAAPAAPFGPATAGASVNYRVYGSNDGPEGPKPFDQTVIVNRATDGTLSVLSGTTPLGTVTPANVPVPDTKAPANLAGLFNPFKHVVELVANKPADVTSASNWKATAVVPFGTHTFSVPLDVTAAVDGTSVKLTAHGTGSDTSNGNYGNTDFAVTVDETANYDNGRFSGSTFAVQTAVKTEFKKNQGVDEKSYSTRYYVAPAT